MNSKIISAQWCLVILSFAAAAAAWAEEPAPTGRGSILTQFSERSEWSDPKKMAARFSVPPRPDEEDYTLTDETFKLIVPADYDESKPAGVLVYITPGESAATMGEAWAEAMAKRNLIFVAPIKADNERPAFVRMGLALDGLHNVQKRYKTDRKRIYVSGMSGGGRCASRLGIVYAEVFDGMFAMCGCDHFDHVPHPADPSHQWRKKFNPPKLEILNMGKTYNRYVFLTGEQDGNQIQTQATATLYRQLAFAYVTYLEVPGMDHTFPPADWFDKGLAALDEPLMGR